MTDKLDQSLDSIMTERRKNTRGKPRPARRAVSGPKPVTAPVGGIKKTTRPSKPAEKVTAAKPASGESKIIVSNLPHDVSETQIKDYFTQTVGRVKKVLLSYGPNGQSRGVATISFNQPSAAAQAAKDLDGLKVDNRPMKIEVILGAKDAPAPTAPKSLSDRIANQPKSAAAAKGKAQPKPATATKAAGGAGAKKGVGKKGAPRARNAGRGKPKTAEELDAEMADYWDGGANGAAGGAAAAAAATNGGAVQPAAAGEVAMDDGIM